MPIFVFFVQPTLLGLLCFIWAHISLSMPIFVFFMQPTFSGTALLYLGIRKPVFVCSTRLRLPLFVHFLFFLLIQLTLVRLLDT